MCILFRQIFYLILYGEIFCPEQNLVASYSEIYLGAFYPERYFVAYYLEIIILNLNQRNVLLNLNILLHLIQKMISLSKLWINILRKWYQIQLDSANCTNQHEHLTFALWKPINRCEGENWKKSNFISKLWKPINRCEGENWKKSIT